MSAIAERVLLKTDRGPIASAPGVPVLPDADEVAERARAVSEGAAARVRTLDERLEGLGAGGCRTSGLGLGLTGLGLAIAVAGSGGLFDRVSLHLVFLGCAAVLALGLAIGVLGLSGEPVGLRKALGVSSQIGASRCLAQAAQRIESALASCLRTEPSAESRGMMMVLVQWLERENEAASRQMGEQDTGATTRRHERIVPRVTKTSVRLADGRILTARIANLSLSGVAIETELAGVALGARVTIGERRARAVRKLGRGMAFEFETPLDPSAFHARIEL